jgi:catechol 2,3-dioxygenase-like lactoylglutathione lyase family enzyme
MATGFTHLALHVRDLEACVAFYETYAGMHLTHDRSSNGKRIVWLAEPGREADFIVVLIPGGPGRVEQPAPAGTRVDTRTGRAAHLFHVLQHAIHVIIGSHCD